MRQNSLRRRTLTSGSGSGSGRVAEEESDTEVRSHERTRQKKFCKYFKELQGEFVTERIACAFVGDILLQGHLYVTDNYLAFHSNVFGYVTKFAITHSSVRSITKEKTAMIIPNAVAVSTGGEKYMFTSFLYRDHAYGVMTQAWNKASHRNSLSMIRSEDGVDGGQTAESDTATETSEAPSLATRTLSTLTGSWGQLSQGSVKQGTVLTGSSLLPSSFSVLVMLVSLLVILLLSSVYLVYRLDAVHQRIETKFK